MKGIRTAWIAGIVLVSTLLPAVAAEQGSADLVWVVDDSVSAGRGDRAANLKGFVTAMTALLAPRLSQVAVVRFGGWAETELEGMTVHAPAAVPSDPAARAAFLAAFAKTLDEGLKFGFTACDVNAAFAESGDLTTFLAGRPGGPDGRPLLVVLLTAGRFQAVETVMLDGRVRVVARKDYIEGAKANAGDANRESVNAEAIRVFRETVAPAVAETPGAGFVCFYTGDGVPEGEKDPLAPLCAPASPLTLATEAGVVQILEAFRAALPDGHPLRADLVPYASETASLGETGEGLARDVLVPQGASDLTLAVVGPPALTATLTGPGGAAPEPGVAFAIHGTGAFRVLNLQDPDPGTWTLAVAAEGAAAGAPVSFGAFRRVDYRLAIEIPGGPAGKRFSGETVPVRVSVTWGDPPTPVTDPATLAGMEVTVDATGPGGEVEGSTKGLREEDESVLEVPIQLGSGEWEGTVEIRARCRAFPREGGGHDFVSPVVTLQFEVVQGIPSIELQFSADKAYVHQEVGLRGRLLQGRLPEGPVALELEPEKEGGAPVPVVLYGGEEPDLLWGKVRFPGEGAWKIPARAGSLAVPGIVRGERLLLRVEPRTVAVETKSGTEFAAVAETRVPFLEDPQEGQEQGGLIFVRADLGASEKGTVRIEGRDVKGWTLEVLAGGKPVGPEGIDVSGDSARVELRVVLKPAGEPPEPGVYKIGTLVPVLVLPGAGEEAAPEIEGAAALEVEVVPGPPPWFMNPVLWAVAGALLLLIVLLVVLFTGPRFAYQNLVLQGDEGVGKAPFFFLDNTFGLKKQKARGTDDLEGAVTVRVAGKGRCTIAAAAKNVEVRVNGRKIAGTFALADGNLVEIRRGEDVFTYRYYTQPAAPVDLGDDEFVLMEYDQDDDFVIAEDEDVPMYDPGEPPADVSAFEGDAAPHGWADDEAPAAGGAPEAEGAPEEPPEEFDDLATIAPPPVAPGPPSEEPPLEEMAPEPDAGLDDLVTSRPPSELVTADPLPMPEGYLKGIQPDAPSDLDEGFGDAPTLMDFNAGDVKAQMKPDVSAGGVGDTPSVADFDDGMTLMGISETGEITHAELRRSAAPAEEEAGASEEPEEPGEEDGEEAGDDDEDIDIDAEDFDEDATFLGNPDEISDSEEEEA